jgi:hypothetical protein
MRKWWLEMVTTARNVVEAPGRYVVIEEEAYYRYVVFHGNLDGCSIPLEMVSLRERERDDAVR